MRQRNGRANNRTAFWLFVFCCVMILPLTVPCFCPMPAQAQESTQLQKTAQTTEALKEFRDKAQLLRSQAIADLEIYQLDESPAGEAGYAVFFSVCDKTSRADVYCGLGVDLESAWQNASEMAEAGIGNGGQFPVWVKADVVNSSYTVSAEDLKNETDASERQYYRYGISLDEDFHSALLEEELNGAKIYDYKNGGIDLEHLNEYLRNAGRKEQAIMQIDAKGNHAKRLTNFFPWHILIMPLSK